MRVEVTLFPTCSFRHTTLSAVLIVSVSRYSVFLEELGNRSDAAHGSLLSTRRYLLSRSLQFRRIIPAQIRFLDPCCSISTLLHIILRIINWSWVSAIFLLEDVWKRTLKWLLWEKMVLAYWFAHNRHPHANNWEDCIGALSGKMQSWLQPCRVKR